MLDANEVADLVDELIKTLNANKFSGSKFSAYFGDGMNFPEVVISLYKSAELVNRKYRFLFFGYYALGEKEISNAVEKKDGDIGFYCRYKCDNGFETDDEMSIVLEDSVDGFLDEPIEIKNLLFLLPLFSFEGNFIALSLDPKNFGALMHIVDTHVANIVAPDLISHLADIKDGVLDGRYPLCDSEIMVPCSWWQRRAVRQGKAEIDEDGDFHLND